MPSANEIAQYFTAHAASRGDTLDERTLQALLYTAQGFSLLMFKQPLFDDPIRVSAIGPLTALSGIGGEGAQEPDDSETREFLSGIYERHGPGAAHVGELYGWEALAESARLNGGRLDLEQMRVPFRTGLARSVPKPKPIDREALLKAVHADEELWEKVRQGLEDSRAGRVYRWE